MTNNTFIVEDIIRYIFQIQNIDYRKIEIKIIYNYDEIIKRIEEVKEKFKGKTEIIISVMNIEKYIIDTYKRYNEISYRLINRISIKSLKKEIKIALISEKIDKIKETFIKYCQEKELLKPFQEEIIKDLEKLALKEELSNHKTSKEIYHR